MFIKSISTSARDALELSTSLRKDTVRVIGRFGYTRSERRGLTEGVGDSPEISNKKRTSLTGNID